MSPEDGEPHLADRAALPYAGIRRDVTDGVPALLDAAFPELFGWLAERDVAPAGPPIVRVWEVDRDGEPLVVEAGVPVATPVDGDETVRADQIPGGRYAVLVHVGPYRHESEPDMADARARLLAFIEDRGLEIGKSSDRGTKPACAVDVMLRSPGDTDDFREWRTELAFLVAG